MQCFEEKNLKIKRYTWDVVDSNSYLIDEAGEALLIDAVASEGLYHDLAGMKSLLIILTHSHFDHVSGLNRIREMVPNTTVLSTDQCSRNVGSIYSNMSSVADVFLSFYCQKNTATKSAVEEDRESNLQRIGSFVCAPSDVVYDRETSFSWRGHDLVLVPCYGHSNDSLVVVFDNYLVFSGDTILNYPTVTRFPKGNTAKFWEHDIPRLERMGNMKVYPGHGDAGQLPDMIAMNSVNRKRRTHT